MAEILLKLALSTNQIQSTVYFPLSTFSMKIKTRHFLYGILNTDMEDFCFHVRY